MSCPTLPGLLVISIPRPMPIVWFSSPLSTRLTLNCLTLPPFISPSHPNPWELHSPRLHGLGETQLVCSCRYGTTLHVYPFTHLTSRLASLVPLTLLDFLNLLFPTLSLHPSLAMPSSCLASLLPTLHKPFTPVLLSPSGLPSSSPTPFAIFHQARLVILSC
jgi:hypothetical protein